ncbi:MAG: efflux RND transporter periplasmic adaptor subunit [Gemmatimonadetes bacterium]|nr:efflux RND transporter periplasmic adaptor subunit [Gemmatimonadota bacterium]
MIRVRRRPSLALGLGALALACGGDEVAEERPLRPVVYQSVGAAAGAAERTFNATAVSGRAVNLSFRNGGVVTRLNMVLGQDVAAGELLAELDNVAARLAYEQAVLALNGAASQMNTAELALARVRSLYEAGTASLSDYENARNAFRTAEASHESAVRSVRIQEENVSYGSIVAPVGGTIAAVDVEVDENVQAGQLVGILNAGEGLEIELGLPEAVIARASPGLEASITFPAVPGQTFEGSVTEVSPSVDPATATYPVRIALIGPSPEIRAGMAATVRLRFPVDASLVGALVVPASAVGEDDEGRFVFVVEPDGEAQGTVRKRRVVVGRLTSEGFEIREGLTSGQNVATAGLQTLLDGQRVRLR